MDLIWPKILIYNFLMFGLDVIACIAIRRRPIPTATLLASFSLVVTSAMVAALVARVPFEILYLICFGWFVHVPLVVGWAAAACRKGHPIWSLAGMVVALSLVAIGVDAFWIEPEWLEVTTVQIQSDKVTRTWRVVLVADLQTDQLSDYERRVFQTVQETEPDLILMAGDYLQIRSKDRTQLCDDFNVFLRGIGFAAPHGVYAVGGNTDERGWEIMFAGLPVTKFVESSGCDVSELHITGLSVLDSFDTSLQLPEDEAFHIVLGHGPDFALGDVQADLLLAGHTHGGQVQLPLIGPLITLSRVPRAWASGTTRLDDRRTLIVSRGIGMERMGSPRLRFLCRPQLVVIEIQPSPNLADTRELRNTSLSTETAP